MSKLTEQEKRVRIAKHCGHDDRCLIVKRGLFYRPKACGYTHNESEAWILPKEQAEKHSYPRGDEPVTIQRATLPDYFHDLNACHEMEKGLDSMPADTRSLFLDQLSIQLNWPKTENAAELRFEVGYLSVRATASQRAEAFGITTGLWEEGE